MYSGEVVGIFTVVWVGCYNIRYRHVHEKKIWQCAIWEWNEWMESKGYLGKRCNGRSSVTNQRSSHTED